MTPVEKRFKAAVMECVKSGKYPGPAAILRRLGRGGHSLNGREVEWRRLVLVMLGWRERRDKPSHLKRVLYSWVRPEYGEGAKWEW